MKIDPKSIDAIAKKSLETAKDPTQKKWKRVIAAIVAIVSGFLFWYGSQSCAYIPDTRIETPSGTIIHLTPRAVDHQK